MSESRRELVAPHDADAVLVLRAQQGNRDAFGQLYARFAPVVHGVLVANAAVDEAHDLVQDVFVRALDRLHTLREPQAFGAWLCAIARNEVRMSRRNKLRLVPLHDDVAQAPDAPDPDGMHVLAAIQALPATYRETLVLRLVEGLSGRDIAERTGLTEGSVRVNLHRGMSLLRERLGGAR